MKISVFALLFTGFLAFASHADELRLQDNAPTRYVVVKGDTLWDISGKFLKDPWKWPQIWGMNKAEIKNPHWIYPGNVILLSDEGGIPHLSLESPDGNLVTVKLSPEIRGESLDNGGIPPLPAAMIHAFDVQPVVLDKGTLEHAPKVVEFEDEHMVVGAGDEVFASNDNDQLQVGTQWKLVRPGKPIVDPDSKEILGYSAEYLGTARTLKAGDPQRVLILSTAREVQDNDRLLPADEGYLFHYVPHAPNLPIQGRVISTVNIMTEAGRYNTVAINKGQRDGVEVGDVLAIYRDTNRTGNPMVHDVIPDFNSSVVGPQAHAHEEATKNLKIPETRSALCMVYRVFDKVAYAMIMDSTHTVTTLDRVRNP